MGKLPSAYFTKFLQFPTSFSINSILESQWQRRNNFGQFTIIVMVSSLRDSPSLPIVNQSIGPAMAMKGSSQSHESLKRKRFQSLSMSPSSSDSGEDINGYQSNQHVNKRRTLTRPKDVASNPNNSHSDTRSLDEDEAMAQRMHYAFVNNIFNELRKVYLNLLYFCFLFENLRLCFATRVLTT